MNILYIIPSFRKSGPVNVCLSLAKNISENDTVSVLAFGGGDAIHDFSIYCKSVNIIPFWSIAAIYKFISNQKFDIIHSHCLLPDFLLCVMSYLMPMKKFITISTIHNYIDVDYVLSKGFFIGSLMGIMNRSSLKRLDSIISCSKSVADYCRENYKIESSSISNGVSSVSDCLISKKKEGVDFYYLGVINERKNVDFLISAFHMYKKKYNNNDRLHIIGGGHGLDILQLDNDCGYIIFHGVQAKPHAIIASLDVYVSSSKAEGMPLALLESLSCGKPYICSDIPPHEEVDHVVGYGIICKLSQLEYIEAFYRSREWNFIELSDKIRNIFSENYSDIIMAKKYKEKYDWLRSGKHEK
ncbi:glycosyltransferase family 4 protein [Citrobacter gillenii]|uniref:glycosyltransferase family 4 protein n=1 Tax=Citrobacter gillenii TaxID=67828 RepID=UPI003987063F